MTESLQLTDYSEAQQAGWALFRERIGQQGRAVTSDVFFGGKGGYVDGDGGFCWEEMWAELSVDHYYTKVVITYDGQLKATTYAW